LPFARRGLRFAPGDLKELELGTLKVAQVNSLRVTRHFTLISPPALIWWARRARSAHLLSGVPDFFRTVHESRSRRPLLKARQIESASGK